MICTVVMIYKAVTSDDTIETHDTCWYLNYVIERSYSVFSWMWYYGFLFFINLLAGISSGIALYKLIHEQRALRKNVDNTTYMGQASTNQVESRFQRRQSAVLTKVVSRCIIYPLIPLAVNIWGFGIQIMMTIRNDRPPFVLVMFDTVFACLEGFFVLMVFFTDPALTTFIDDRLQYWRKVYVTEYRSVTIRNDSSTIQEQKMDKSHTLYIMPPMDNGDCMDENLTNWNAAIIHANETSRYSGTNHNSIPMRRIAIPPSTLSQLSSHYNIRQLSFCTLPTMSDTMESGNHHHDTLGQHQQGQFIESSTANLTNGDQPAHFSTQESIIHNVFVPYKSAVWARICHYLLSRLDLSFLTSSTSRSAPQSSTTIELRTYSQQPPLQQHDDDDDEGNNATATISDDCDNTIGTGHSNDIPIESNNRYRFSSSADTCHY
ncbi:hypothetical protein BC941DRAFT_438576 [Chlamydoabsidia padenii]|nr:hypothetical protein BC941DRAFT_438576 [Chlamydoabsidia padenii]